MTKLYYTIINEVEFLLEKILPYVSKYRQEKITSLPPIKAVQSALSELLVTYALLNQKVKFSNINHVFHPDSKPVFNEQYSISIAHSKNVVVVAISDHEVGVDVQIVDEKYLSLKDKILNDEELLMFDWSIIKLIESFSAKESFLKKHSLNLSFGLKNLTYINGTVFSKTNKDVIKTFKLNILDENYILSITTNNHKHIKPLFVPIDSMLFASQGTKQQYKNI